MRKAPVNGGTGLLESFTSLLNTSIDGNGRVAIPKQLGKGYLKVFNFDPGLRLMIRDYELFRPLPVKKTTRQCSTERVVLLFQNLFLANNRYADSVSPDKKLMPSIQVFSENIDPEILFSGATVFKTIVIAVEVAYLKVLLKEDLENKILATIAACNSPFLFEVSVPPSIHKVAQEMLEVEIPEVLSNFYFKVKAEELICHLFAALLKREATTVAALNINDMQTIYKIRDGMLAQLDTQPNLSDLAVKANFSKSKLKRLFKQIFGMSIFHYYQYFRMQEAARLLKENKFSVSEVGYQMGFSNLSHFTRTFEKHFGMKPKKFSMSRGQRAI